MSAAETMSRALIELTQDGQRPPCGYSSDQWLSEDRDQRTAACHRCQTCRLLDLCQEYAAELKPRFGVWAGKDYTPRPQKARTTQ